MNAVKSGRFLENLVFKELNKIPNLKVFPQYKYSDIFGARARIDFFVENKYSRKFFIECKNHNVRGSLDQKFSYYIENIREDRYEGNPLIFVLNTNGIRPKVLNYLVNNTKKFNYIVVDIYNVYKLYKIIYNKTCEHVFLKK